MRNSQCTFKTRKWSFISAFSICMTVPLRLNLTWAKAKLLLFSSLLFYVQRVYGTPYGRYGICLVKFNTLKSLTKKLNHLDYIKWHRRCKYLTFKKTSTRSWLKQRQKPSKMFCRFSRKKIRVGTFKQGRSGNRKHAYLFT